MGLGAPRYNGDASVFLDAINDEIDGFGCREVGQDGVQGRFDRQHIGGHAENADVEKQHDVADREAGFAAQVDGHDFGAVEHAAPAHGQPDTGTQEKAPEYRNQQLILRDDGEMNGGQHNGQGQNGQQRPQSHPLAELPASHQHKRQVECHDKHRQR